MYNSRTRVYHPPRPLALPITFIFISNRSKRFKLIFFLRLFVVFLFHVSIMVASSIWERYKTTYVVVVEKPLVTLRNNQFQRCPLERQHIDKQDVVHPLWLRSLVGSNTCRGKNKKRKNFVGCPIDPTFFFSILSNDEDDVQRWCYKY